MVKLINLKIYGRPLGIKTASGERFCSRFYSRVFVTTGGSQVW